MCVYIFQGFPQHLQSSLKGVQELAGSDLPQSMNKGMQLKHRQKHYLKCPFNDHGPLGCSTSVDLGWIICVLFPPAVPVVPATELLEGREKGRLKTATSVLNCRRVSLFFSCSLQEANCCHLSGRECPYN